MKPVNHNLHQQSEIRARKNPLECDNEISNNNSLENKYCSFLEQSRNLVFASSNDFFSTGENNFIVNNVSKFKSTVVVNQTLLNHTRNNACKSIHTYFNNFRTNGINLGSIDRISGDHKEKAKKSKKGSLNHEFITPNRIFPFLPRYRYRYNSDNSEMISKSSSRSIFQTSSKFFIENTDMNITENLANTKKTLKDTHSNNKCFNKSDMPSPIDNKTTEQNLTAISEARDFRKTLSNIEALKLDLPMNSDSAGYTQLKQYALKDEIGKGSYGIVKLAYNKLDNKNYAMKMISKKKLMKKNTLLMRPPSRKKSVQGSASAAPKQPYDRIYKEIAILKKLDHENVVKLIEVLDDPNDDYFCLVFELVEKGLIIDIPTNNPLSEEMAWVYFRELTKGIEYLHVNKIVHRDIKPSNLLLSDDGHVKIVDFGISNEFDGDDAVLSNSVGTPAFIPPEALKENSPSWMGKPLDVWTMGITLFSFVYGFCPFRDDCPITLRSQIQYDDVIFPDMPETSATIKDLILKLLTKDPLERITMCKIKEHAWVTKNDTCPLVTNLDNSQAITVTEDEVKNSIKSLYKLDTLILIKTMIKNRSFSNPFRASLSSQSMLDIS